MYRSAGAELNRDLLKGRQIVKGLLVDNAPLKGHRGRRWRKAVYVFREQLFELRPTPLLPLGRAAYRSLFSFKNEQGGQGIRK